jgi:hypothetical protein
MHNQFLYMVAVSDAFCLFWRKVMFIEPIKEKMGHRNPWAPVDSHSMYAFFAQDLHVFVGQVRIAPTDSVATQDLYLLPTDSDAQDLHVCRSQRAAKDAEGPRGSGALWAAICTRSRHPPEPRLRPTGLEPVHLQAVRAEDHAAKMPRHIWRLSTCCVKNCLYGDLWTHEDREDEPPAPPLERVYWYGLFAHRSLAAA